MKSRALTLSFISAIAVGALHFLGAKYDLYYLISWYDSLVHLLTGIGIGSISLWFQNKVWPYASYSKLHSLVWVLSAALFFGILWEVFEIRLGLMTLFPSRLFSYGVDTTKDLVIDICGAVVAFIYIRKKK